MQYGGHLFAARKAVITPPTQAPKLEFRPGLYAILFAALIGILLFIAVVVFTFYR